MDKGITETTILLKQWHDGKREGLDAMLERHLSWLQVEVRRRLTPQLRKKAETVDYIQDAVVQFLTYAPSFTISVEAEFRALLLKVVESTLLNKYDWYTARRRQMSRERPLPSDTVLSLDCPQGVVKTPSKSAERHEREAWVRFAMEFLDPGDREIIVFRQWDTMSFAEIGGRLGITQDAARMRHNRAMDRLTDKVWNLRSGKLSEAL